MWERGVSVTLSVWFYFFSCIFFGFGFVFVFVMELVQWTVLLVKLKFHIRLVMKTSWDEVVIVPVTDVHQMRPRSRDNKNFMPYLICSNPRKFSCLK